MYMLCYIHSMYVYDMIYVYAMLYTQHVCICYDICIYYAIYTACMCMLWYICTAYMYMLWYMYIIIIIIIIKKFGNVRPGEWDWHPISPNTPAPHYQPIEEKKRKENSWRQKRREQLSQQKGIGPALETRQSHTIEYGVNQIVPEILRGE